MRNAKKLLAIFVAVLMVTSMFALSTVTASADVGNVIAQKNGAKPLSTLDPDAKIIDIFPGTTAGFEGKPDCVTKLLNANGTVFADGSPTDTVVFSRTAANTGNATWKVQYGNPGRAYNIGYNQFQGTANTAIEFTFTGTGVGFAMSRRANQSLNTEIYVDGSSTAAATVATRGAGNTTEEWAEILWEVRDLTDAQHTVKLVGVDRLDADAFVIYNEPTTPETTTEAPTEAETTTEAPVVPVTNISGVPTSFPSITGGVALAGTVEPADATNKAITWSVKSGAGAIASNKLTATSYGDILVTATIADGIANGTDYTQDFTISAGTAPIAASGHYSILNSEIYSPNNWSTFTAGSDEDGSYRMSTLNANQSNAIYFIANNERNNGINASNFKTLVIKGKFGCGLNTAAADFVKFRTGAYGLEAGSSVNLTNINTNNKAGEDRITYLVFSIENDKNTINHTIKDFQLKPKSNSTATTAKIYDVYLSSNSAEDVLADLVVDTTVSAGQISTTLVDDGANVEVRVDNNSNDDKEFQFWSYRKVSSDIAADYAWVLVKEYGVQKSFKFSADGAKDKDGNYTNMVRYKHNGEYVAQFVTSVSGAAAGEVGINSIKLDGKVIADKINMPVGSTPALAVSAVNATSIKVDGVAANTTGTDTLIGETVLDCSKAGTRKVSIEVTGDNGTVTKEFTLNVYNTTTPASDSFATIDSATFTVSANAKSVEYSLVSSGATEFSISMADGGWRAIGMPKTRTDATGTVVLSSQTKKLYGTFLVKAKASSDNTVGTDDLVYDYITNNRPGAKTFTVAPSVPAGNVAVGTPINFTATATIENTTTVEYAFIRMDARGPILVKDYSTDNTFTWTPALDGAYKIVAVAKGTDAAAHELREEFSYNVGDTAVAGANITATVKTMSGANHSATGLQARVPYIITVDAGVTGVQYNAACGKANFSSAFSPDNQIIFTANKPGTYNIDLGIRKNGTGGLATQTQTFTVTVQ